MEPGALLAGIFPRRTTRSERSVSTAALLAVTLFAAGIFCPAAAAPSPATAPPGGVASGEAGTLARTTGPRIETTVVAMSLRGIGRLDVLTVPDLDIVERVDGTRFLPLVRLLRTLGIEPLDSASVLVFVPDGAPAVTVDYAAGTASMGHAPVSVPMVVAKPAISKAPLLVTTREVLSGSALAMPICSRPPFAVVVPV